MEENKPKYVIDASTAIKWVVDEKHSEVALKIRYFYELDLIYLLVPSVFFWEVLNTISRKKPEMAMPFLSEIKMADILECRLSESQTLKSIELMQKYPKISFYDASYHALAIEEQGTFITADKKYYEIAKKEGHIQLLEDFKV